jgi:CHAD domain-containing protein
MSYRVTKKTARVAHGFRAALRGQIAAAIKELDISSRASRAGRIHNVRRRLKRVRSALRLLEGASFADITRIDHDLLRDAAAEVAASRSADANLAALKNLCEQSGSDPLRFSRAFAALEKERLAVAHATTAGMHKAGTLLKGSLSRIDAWSDTVIEWNNVLQSIGHFYKRGRGAHRKVVREATTENFHQWRKRSKDLYHGLKLVCGAGSKKARRPVRQMKKLSVLLGADHDLALLREALDKQRLGKEKEVIEKLIAVRRRDLQEKALKLGAKYFSRKPGAFIGRIA